ncbi:uncharacterized protein V1510DRAFT_419079 [Dipodascopsis tothii]|uniref:uncharacterized protein n=1 Tax=Dipodascopsis tothii TaxID=44089 RepID=UPI0034CE6D28
MFFKTDQAHTSGPEGSAGESTTETKQASVERLRGFVDERPEHKYFFNGDGDRSFLCRPNEQGGRSCVNLMLPTTQLLAEMQKLDYFCALGQNPNSSDIECHRIS